MAIYFTVKINNEENQFLLKKTLNIGRGSDNDIVISSSKISKQHAQIIYDLTGKIYLRDLFSKNGTSLNNVLITMEQIYLGDIITIGDAVIKIANEELTPVEKKRIGFRLKTQAQKKEVTLKIDFKKTKKTKITKMTKATKIKKV